MAEADPAEGGPDLEAPVEELEGEREALLHFGKFFEARHERPWEQWTFREKANFYMDRIFLVLLVIFFLMLLGESGYKMWYVTNIRKVAEFVSDFVVFVFNWLFNQEGQEELYELLVVNRE